MNYLTSIRGIAALLVVLYHIKPSLLANEYTSSFSWLYGKGYLAVDFFFILSGFIIAYKYQALFQNSFSLSDYRSFMVKRIARVFPLHAFVMLCYLFIPLAFFITQRSIDSSVYRFDTFFVKFFLVDLWLLGNDYWDAWNIPSWTISGELFAYLIFPLLAVIVCIHKKLKYLIFMVAVVSIATLYEIFDSRSLGGNISHLGLFRCLLEFLCGICIYNIFMSIRDRAKQEICHVVFWLVAVLLGLLMYFFTENHFFVPLLFSALLLMLLNFRSWLHKILENKYLVILGDISYSVYLNHMLVLTLYTMIIINNGELLALVDIFYYITITLLFSLVTYKYVEVPLRKQICDKTLGKHQAKENN